MNYERSERPGALDVMVPRITCSSSWASMPEPQRRARRR